MRCQLSFQSPSSIADILRELCLQSLQDFAQDMKGIHAEAELNSLLS